MQPAVIIHLPHASTLVPKEEAARFALTPAELDRELLRMTDRYTDELFALPASLATPVIFPVSRLVVDPERFLDDEQEPMAARGMGVIYQKTSDGKTLRPALAPEERERLLQTYYVPHHEQLETLALGALEARGRCLLLDAHSFPSRPLPCDLDQKPDRPEICIGTDSYHTPIRLVRAACRRFEEQGWQVSIDRPYSGSLVPGRFYRKNPNVTSLMIEVNRKLYMDERTGEKLPGFNAVRERLQTCLRGLVEERLSSP